MIDIEYLKSFYPPYISGNPSMQKNILKEYIELLVLDYLVTTPYMQKLTFIGGTNLRLIKGVQRFSEDLDFDCKNLTESEFIKMTDSVVSFLKANGLNAETKDKENPKLTAFRRNIVFPGLLYDMNLTKHKEERFLLKIEAQDQGVDYVREVKTINRNGFHFMTPRKVSAKKMTIAPATMFTTVCHLLRNLPTV
ncbi:MAG: nucleotidyl transferase AbiEii/AbiGii toxin family protein, partial [Paludibacteraceae bacterium]|nr:nucleotidyl transferase AbiEii/AbiGii toxin family protein [Paludibacteraceae bacterium]